MLNREGFGASLQTKRTNKSVMGAAADNVGNLCRLLPWSESTRMFLQPTREEALQGAVSGERENNQIDDISTGTKS